MYDSDRNSASFRNVIRHPPHSPDIAPSDYRLFRSMQHFLKEKIFKTYDQVKNGLDQYFALKPAEFYERGIKMLPERWKR